MQGRIRKIAFVLPNFEAGGAERVMLTVASNLDRSRFEPVILVFNDAGPLRNIIAEDIRVVSLNAKKVSRGAFSFVRAVWECSPDLVISTMAHLNIAVLLMKPFLPKVPIIVREAITPGFFSKSPVKYMILMAGYYLLYPFADGILSPTRMVFEEMPASLRRRKGKLRRIYNPVNETMIRKKSDGVVRESLARPGQKLFIAAGRLVDQKGFDLLIEALKVWKSKDDWRLVILGEGPDHQKLQEMIDISGMYQVKLGGYKENPWMFFAVADRFLLPSRYEGLPNVALEALALGAPVIAMDTAGGIAEIAEEAESGDVRIADSMDAFLKMMGEVSAAEAAGPRKTLLPECFSLGAVVSAYQDAFDGLLSVRH
ncbi:MAG TPA: hypothetical protein DEA55_03110 [Rhodospirillaceae bacterium]|nr:hypothetical protein [Rhodospirillaceae bacterium]